MSVTKERKSELIKEFSRHGKDSGSCEVQISVLSERINNLTQHFKTHKKDQSSRRGLLQMVMRRRSLLDYLARRKPEIYQTIIKKLELRR